MFHLQRLKFTICIGFICYQFGLQSTTFKGVLISINDCIIHRCQEPFIGKQLINKTWRCMTGGGSVAIITLKIRNPWFANVYGVTLIVGAINWKGLYHLSICIRYQFGLQSSTFEWKLSIRQRSYHWQWKDTLSWLSTNRQNVTLRDRWAWQYSHWKSGILPDLPITGCVPYATPTI